MSHKNGATIDGKMTPEYQVWAGMRKRCTNPRAHGYESYGGRGIRVCERWESFANFMTDMGPRPSPSHSIDRINSDGDYSPDNCRWATRTEQNRNRRNVRLSVAIADDIRLRHANGERQAHIARQLGILDASVSAVLRGKAWRAR